MPNTQDIVALFLMCSEDEANRFWCAAFVYYCVILAGFEIPVRPKEFSCSFAGGVAWEEWTQITVSNARSGNDDAFKPADGDIVFLIECSTIRIMIILALYRKIMMNIS